MIVINPTGTIIQICLTNLNNLNTIYGAMFLNGTLYIGWSTTNGMLFPVNYGSGVATLGTGIPLPTGLSMRDLANCHDSSEVNTQGLVDVMSTSQVTVFPNPSMDGWFTVDGIEGLHQLYVTDMMGTVVWREKISGSHCSFLLEEAGVYLIWMNGPERRRVAKVVVAK